MVRLPDINIQSWIEDQQEQFKQSTSGLFDALNFDLGAREMSSQIPPDYPLPGGPDQWQQAEAQRIQDELDRAMREEEERRRQQAALEEQQRQQQEAERQAAAEAQAMSWSQRLGIPTPDEVGEHLQGLWNRPADNIGTTGAIPEATPAADQALRRVFDAGAGALPTSTTTSGLLSQTPFGSYGSGRNTDVEDFLNWSGGAISGAAGAVPEALERGTEAYREFQQSPLGMAGGMPAAIAGTSEVSQAITDPLLRGAARGSGIVSQEGGSSGIDVNVPIYGRFAPSEEDIVAGVGGAILDPTNLLLEEGPMVRALGRGARTAAELAAEQTASAIRRAQGDTGAGMLRRGAERALEAAEGWARGGRKLPGQRVIPAEVVDELDIPIRLPTDPNALDAIRRAGGTVDDRGVTVHTVRMQDEAGEGQLQTRGGVFALAGPPGMRSTYEGAEGAQTGGQNRIEGWTRFRNPLILYDAPGSEHGGFQEAARKLNLQQRIDPAEYEAAQNAADLARNQWEEAKLRVDALQRQIEAMEAQGHVFPQREWDPIDIDATPEARSLWHEFQAAADRETDLSQEDTIARTTLRNMEQPNNAPEDIERDIGHAIREARRAGPPGSAERAEVLKRIVARYGGEPETIDEMLRIRGENQESAWSIRENIIAHNARRQGHDGVLVINPTYDQDFTKAIDAAIEAIPEYAALKQKVTEQWQHYEAQEQYATQIMQTHGANSLEHQEAVQGFNDAYEEASKLQRQLDRMHDRLVGTVEIQQPHQITELADYREGLNPTQGPMQTNPRLAQIRGEITRLQEEKATIEQTNQRLLERMNQPVPPDASVPADQYYQSELDEYMQGMGRMAEIDRGIRGQERQYALTPQRVRATMLNPNYPPLAQRFRELEDAYDAANAAYKASQTRGTPLEEVNRLRNQKNLLRSQLVNIMDELDRTPENLPVGRPGFGIREDIPRKVPGERFPGELEGPLPRQGEFPPPPAGTDDIIYLGEEEVPVDAGGIPYDLPEVPVPNDLKKALADLAFADFDLPGDALTQEALQLEQRLRSRTGLGIMDVLAHPDVISGLQGAVAAPIGAGDFREDDRSPLERLRDIALHAGLGAAVGVAARRGTRRLTRQVPTVLSRAAEEEIQAAGRAARAAPDAQKIEAIRAMKAAGLSSEAAERELATGSRMTLDEVRQATAQAEPAATQAARAGTDVAEASVPRQPPPPNSKPAKPKGSATKTVAIGAENAPAPKGPPLKAGEEVMVNADEGVDIGRVRSYDPRTDSVTILTGDGTSIRAKSADLERQGAATTRTSPHPGFSTGESEPIPVNPGGVGGGGGRQPPAPPGGPVPTPPPTPPGRPSTGPGSLADQQLDRILQKNEDIARGRIKAGPATPDEISKIGQWITYVRQKLTDRRAPLEKLEKYLEGVTGQPLTVQQRAHLAARIYEGHADAAKARLERVLQPAYSQLSEAELKHMDAVWELLDNVDKEEAVRFRAQQESLGKKLPQAKSPREDVRRVAEAELEEKRSRTRVRAAEKEVMAAEKERSEILADMERLGIDTERRPPQEPGKRRAKRETQRLETPEISAAHDRWTKNVIRNETAKARLADAREHEEHAIQWAQERIDRNRAISAERHAENVKAARKTPSGVINQEKDTILANLKQRVGDESYARIRKALDASLAMRDEMRGEMVASGIWSNELNDTLRENFPHYTPTKLIEHLQEMDDAAAGGRTFSISDNLVHKLSEKGSEGARKSAVQSLVEMVYQYQEAIGRNNVMRKVAGWAEDPRMAPFIKKLREGEKPPQGFETMSAMIDGNVQRLAVLKPYSEALRLQSAFQNGAGGKILSAFSSPLRVGATAGRPAFIVTNAVHDAMTTLFRFTTSSPNPIEAVRSVTDLLAGYRATFGMAGYGTRAAVGGITGAGIEATREAKEAYAGEEGAFSPIKIAAAGLAGAGLGAAVRATAADRAALQAMREAGGSIGQRGRWGKETIPTLIDELRGQKRLIRVARTEGDLKSFLSTERWGQAKDLAGLFWTRPLENVGQIVETAPRLAAFRRAQRQGYSLEESANAARRITADFSAGGAWTKNVNTLIPFLNASTQGAVEDLLSIRNNPAKAAAALAVIVPTVMATEIWNMSVAPDDYQDVSRYTQDHGLVMLDPNAPEGEGKRGLLFIPTRGMLGSIVALTKNVMHAYIGDDPRSWQKLAGDTAITTIQNLSPVSADAVGFLQSFTPPLSGTAYELMANYDSFRRQPIVSRSMETLPVTEQYDDRTSQLARRISRDAPTLLFGGSSPMKIDWALRSISPGPGEAVLGAADAIIRWTGNDLPTNTSRDVPRGARDVPVVGTISGRFLRTAGSERQNLAYEAADEIAAKMRPDMIAYLERSPEYQEATPDKQRQMLRSMETELMQLARDQAGVGLYDRGRDVGLPERFEGVRPGSRLEAEIVSAHNTPRRQRTDRQQDLVSEYRRESSAYRRAARVARKEDTAFRTERRSYLAQEMAQEGWG